jgi:hypothetical protein
MVGFIGEFSPVSFIGKAGFLWPMDFYLDFSSSPRLAFLNVKGYLPMEGLALNLLMAFLLL